MAGLILIEFYVCEKQANIEDTADISSYYGPGWLTIVHGPCLTLSAKSL